MRNSSIDELRILLAFLVVVVHALCAYSDYVIPISRCAVPCFFLISGYFCSGENFHLKIRKSFRRILWLCVWSTILYFPLIYSRLLELDFRGIVLRLVFWLACNEVPNVSHLWYLYCYLYTLAVVAFFEKLRIRKWLLFCSPIFLILSVAFGKYSTMLFGIDIKYQIVRNFLFTGIPFFCIGMYIKVRGPQVSRSVLSWMILIFCITSVIEGFCTIGDGSGDLYFSSPFLAILLLLYVTNNSSVKSTRMSEWGKKYSLYIYIFHPYVLLWYNEITSGVYQCEMLSTINYHAMPVIVFILTFLLVLFFDKMKITKVLK